MALLVQLIVETTLSRAGADLWSHTDTVQSFLALMVTTTKKVPGLLLPNHINAIYHFGKLLGIENDIYSHFFYIFLSF